MIASTTEEEEEDRPRPRPRRSLFTVLLGDGDGRVGRVGSRRPPSRRGRDPVAKHLMTEQSSRARFPDVPHRWLCDGRLLLLDEPDNPGNGDLFKVRGGRGYEDLPTF